jgi:NAD+ kinase
VDDDFENENYFHFNPNHDDDDDHGMIPAYSPSPDKMQTKRFPSYKQKQKYNGDNDPTATTANDLPKPPTKLCFGHGDRICLSIRMRLDCRIISKRDGIVKARYNVLNEVVIDRGLSPYLTILECFCDDEHLTTVQADGVIFATPTGSTAYSLAAGSSVVHPAVPCILVTPICPHVLSFRSMVFPDHVVLRAYVPHDARSEASISFDGKHRQELRRGDSVEIRMSSYPVPTINRKDHSADWLHSLKRGLYFNARPKQMPF